MNNKGYSYIEVLIAGAILSIFIIPVILTIHQSMRNLEFSRKRYNAVILADSLLIEAGNSILIMDNLRNELGAIHSSSALIVDLLNIAQDEFNTRYKTHLFNYVLRIDNYSFSTGEVSSGYLFTCADMQAERTSNYSLKAKYRTNIYYHEIIRYKNNVLVVTQTRGYINIDNNNISIEIPHYITDNISILIDLSSMQASYIEIDIRNFSAGNVHVEVYRYKSLPHENIKITQKSERTSGGILTTISKGNATHEEALLQLMLTVEIYDKYNNMLNRVFRPIIV